MNTYDKIQKAKRDNEHKVLRLIRKANRRGALWNFWYGHNVGHHPHGQALSNALRRLIEAGKVMCLPRRGRRGYGHRLATVRAPQQGWQVVDHFGRMPGDQYYMG